MSCAKWGLRLAVASLASLAGCNIFQPAPSNGTAYPISPPSVTPAPAATQSATPMSDAANGTTMPSVLKVPADAVQLSSGDYPPPAFPAPSQPGLLMVVDMDGDPTTAVASTAVSGKDAGKTMSITDVANMSITMNKLHKYRIVFVPSKATSP